jgi:hypothetical protein
MGRRSGTPRGDIRAKRSLRSHNGDATRQPCWAACWRSTSRTIQWPCAVVEFADRVGQQPEPMRLPPPSPFAISRMEEALGLLRLLEAEDSKQARVGAVGSHAVEGDLLALRDRTRDGASAFAVWAQHDRET